MRLLAVLFVEHIPHGVCDQVADVPDLDGMLRDWIRIWLDIDYSRGIGLQEIPEELAIASSDDDWKPLGSV